MAEIGYALSCEEHPANDLVAYAREAEQAGFTFALISDHYHPWTDRQGQSPFVWSVLGAIAHATKTLRIGTGVTCPTIRIHPAVIAHAAATVATMMPGRFFLGVGTGENLNEHILGDPWPAVDVRRKMLEESIEVMRLLWRGGFRSHHGEHYDVEQARIYTLPETPPPVMVAASGPAAAEMAGRLADGLIGVSADDKLVRSFDDAGGKGKPKYGQVMVCYNSDEATARRIAHEWWPNAAIPGELGQELPLPRHFEQAAQLVDEDDVAEAVVCGPDPGRHIDKITEFVNAGYDYVYVHQIGPDQRGFLRFYEEQILPKLR